MMGLVWLLIGLDSRLHFFPVKHGFFFFFTWQTNVFWSFAVLFMSLCQQPKDFQQSIVVEIRIGSPSALCESKYRGRQICASNINTSDPDHSSQERPDSCYEIGWQRLWWVFASETAQRNLKLTQFADGLLSKAIDFLCVSNSLTTYDCECGRMCVSCEENKRTFVPKQWGSCTWTRES